MKQRLPAGVFIVLTLAVLLKVFDEALTLQPGEAIFRLEPRGEERSRDEQVPEGSSP